MRQFLAITLTLFAVSSSAQAGAMMTVVDLDLNNFGFKDPTVTVAVDGSSAMLEEDLGLGVVFLVNDPFFGDPMIILPEIGGLPTVLSFDYDFMVPGLPSVNDDEFGAYVFDSSTGISVGPAFEFFTTSAGTGTVSFDLASLAGMSLGFVFGLAALPGDNDVDSKVTVSSLQLTTTSPDVGVVPEPSGMIVWGLLTGATLLPFRRRSKMN